MDESKIIMQNKWGQTKKVTYRMAPLILEKAMV